MKRFHLILSFFISTILSVSVIASENPDDKKFKTNMPDDVRAVVEKSCFGCHNSDSRNEDAKEELDFKNLNSLKTFKKIGTYRDIAEVLEEDEMPPKKFAEKYPERVPTEAEEKLLSDWVKNEAQKLVDSQ
ncbi:MAG TPA: heme-binding domain-containing protein [Prolixibacteraceae bacterium]|nr:heme-binding domain-containing protein [Prolixibacteraceae bacterium]